jgi:hypothetical protein
MGKSDNPVTNIMSTQLSVMRRNLSADTSYASWPSPCCPADYVGLTYLGVGSEDLVKTLWRKGANAAQISLMRKTLKTKVYMRNWGNGKISVI